MTKTGLFLLGLCFLALVPAVSAQTVVPDSLEQLKQDMYSLYSNPDSAKFFGVVERLKAAALQAGDERLFYKAWINQAGYTFARVSRERGLAMNNEIRGYATSHNSHYGIYASFHASASMFSTMRNSEKAEEYFLKSIDYASRYIPDESMAANYLGLAKVYQNRGNAIKVEEMADNVLADSACNKLHRLTAWSYKCLANSEPNHSSLERFNAFYAEREKAKADYGHDDNFGDVVRYSWLIMNKHYEEALELTDSMLPMDQKRLSTRIYKLMGRYKEAYFALIKYRDYRDSVNNQQLKRQSMENAMALDLVKAESEAKDLRLANQELLLSQITHDLEQQRLEAAAGELHLRNTELQLQNADAALQNAIMQRRADSLQQQAQEARLSEYRSQLTAQQQADRNRRTIGWLSYSLVALVLAAMVFFLWRRHRQMRKLAAVYSQLLTAYDQLEQTTSAKERIESELRIARNIQMSMVPSVFPDRPDLDLFALMTPAKEVGGDLYTFFITGDQLYFAVGDVSGKGVPASLFMAQCTQLFRSLAIQQKSPAEIANELNRELGQNNELGMFVTMFIGLANLVTGALDFCNCGHNPPVLDGQFLEMFPNAPIALWPDLDFMGEHIDNVRARTLFLYTDGLNEAENSRQEQFGEERMLRLLNRTGVSSRQLITQMEDEVARFVAGAEPSDDLTMMCIRIKNK